MNLTHILILYAVVHALICAAVYLCVRRRVLKFSEQLMPIIVLVPFAGLGTAVIADYYSRRHLSGTRPMTVEELHLDDEFFTEIRSSMRSCCTTPVWMKI